MEQLVNHLEQLLEYLSSPLPGFRRHRSLSLSFYRFRRLRLTVDAVGSCRASRIPTRGSGTPPARRSVKCAATLGSVSHSISMIPTTLPIGIPCSTNANSSLRRSCWRWQHCSHSSIFLALWQRTNSASPLFSSSTTRRLFPRSLRACTTNPLGTPPVRSLLPHSPFRKLTGPQCAGPRGVRSHQLLRRGRPGDYAAVPGTAPLKARQPPPDGTATAYARYLCLLLTLVGKPFRAGAGPHGSRSCRRLHQDRVCKGTDKKRKRKDVSIPPCVFADQQPSLALSTISFSLTPTTVL